VTVENLLSNIVTKTALSATDVRAAISALNEEVIAALADGRSVHIAGLCRLSLSLSETLPAPNAEVTPNVVVKVNIQADHTLREAIRSTTRMEKVVRGTKRPIILSFVDVASNGKDRFTPASIGRVIGDNLKFDPSDVEQGVFFIDEDGAEVRAQVYSQTGNTGITLLVPNGLTGSLQLAVRTRYNGGPLRSETYDSLLTAA
jgi:nucleoid DNA-binding protein